MRLALFDLDGTLLDFDSDHAFGEYLVRLGWVEADAQRSANDHFYAQYQAGCLDINAYIHFATAALRRRSADELAAARRGFIDQVVRPAMRDAALALVRRHAEAGDRIAIVTATNEFITQPIAALFDVPTLIATELERDASGRYTGAVRGVPSYREGKVQRVEQWLGEGGHKRDDFERTVVYSDSPNDLPLLEWASHPVATNPAPALHAVAAERGWPILKLFE